MADTDVFRLTNRSYTAIALSRGRVAEIAFFLFFFFCLDHSWDAPRSSIEPARTGLIVLSGAFLIALLGTTRLRALRALKPVGWVYVAFLLYACLSASWSDDFSSSVQKSAAILFTSTVAFFVATALSEIRIWRAIYLALFVAVMTCTALAVFLPEIGTESSLAHAGKWRGFLGQKNSFGIHSATLVVLASCLLSVKGYQYVFSSRLGQLALWLGVLVGLVGVNYSGSRSAIMLLIVGLLFLTFFRLRGAKSVLMVAVLSVAAFAFAIVAIDSLVIRGGEAYIFSWTVSSSSRFLFWDFAIDHLSDELIFGYGLRGFWAGGRYYEFLANHGWVLPNLHSSYLAILSETGIIGIGLFVAAAAMYLLSTYGQKLSGRIDSVAAISPVIVMVVLTSGLTETLFWRAAGTLQVTFSLVLFVSALSHWRMRNPRLVY